MGTLFRWLGLLILLSIGYWLYHEAKIQGRLETPDTSKVALIFCGIIIDGLVVALVLAFMIVPIIGNSVGSYFFSPSEKMEKTPHSDAVAKLAQGDPEGAIVEYQKVLEKDPSDTHALSEIVRICCRDLGDTARAASFLERALEREWTPEQALFVANRLADVYVLQDDPMRARQLLTDVAQNMEGSRQAMVALRRVAEIERALQTGSRPSLSIPGSHEPEATAPQA